MSADRWSYCPRCTDQLTEAKAKALQAVKDSYGKVEIEEFDKLRDVAEKMPVQTEHETFREDYECYQADGELYIHYIGSCKECGLDVEHHHETTFYEVRSTS